MKAKGKKSADLCTSSDQLPLEEILSRLPVKSLLKCKCVCRAWRTLIEDPTFISMHLNQFEKNDHRFLLYNPCFNPQYFKCCLRGKNISGTEEIILSSSQIEAFYAHMVVGSCNGLVCLYNSNYCSHLKIHIWNPSTRKVIVLPPCPGKADNNVAFQFPGFGFCSKSNDYKVVKVTFAKPSTCPQAKVEVYSLRTNSWKTIGIADPDRFGSFSLGPETIFSNGACYCNWITQDIISLRLRNLRIMSYKFEEEVFREIKPPNYNFDDLSGYLMIREYGNSLSLVSENSRNWDVWVMKEYGVAESWVKQFTLEVARFLNPQAQIAEFAAKFEVVSFTNDGEVALVDRHNRRMFWYDTETKKVEEQELVFMHQLKGVIKVKESLVSLPGYEKQLIN